MAYADQTMSGNKIVAIVIVGLIHLAVGYALVTGLAYSAMRKAIERVTTVDIDEPTPEKTEEPPPPDKTPPPPPIVAPVPPININPAPPPIQTVINLPPPAPVFRTAPPPAPPAPPRVSHAKGAQPKGQARWQQSIIDNYPSRAIRSQTEGTVGVSVTVGADGKVASCSVSSSSGSDILDQAACDGIQRYARFDPALDEDGNPTTGRWGTRIVYKLN